MYLINQVSKITGLTKKALRYYDEQNILSPSCRDDENGYRWYSEDDVKKAHLIQMLRKFDFSISEIKDTLNVAQSEEDLSYVLKEKIENIENHIAKEKALIRDIKKELEPMFSESGEKNYVITIEDIAPVTVAGLRIKDGYDQVGKYIPKLLKEVKGDANGNIFNCYYDEDCVETADMEICVPVRKMVSGNGVSSRKLPSVKAVCTTHYGSYDTLKYAYKELFRYVNEKNIHLLIPSREEYIKGPGMIFKGNPEKYITKIILPFEG